VGRGGGEGREGGLKGGGLRIGHAYNNHFRRGKTDIKNKADNRIVTGSRQKQEKWTTTKGMKYSTETNYGESKQTTHPHGRPTRTTYSAVFQQ
jgi:hypothetical protein